MMIPSQGEVPPSLKDRRQSLRSQRRLKGWQSLWRFVFLSGLAGGLIWVMSLPNWAIRSRSQIEVKGNQLLAVEQVRQWFPLSSGKSVWDLPTQQLSQQLEAIPPIAQVKMTRQLFPPKLTIVVKERQPVAEATSAQEVGFLDEQGVFIPQKFYAKATQNTLKPTLKVIGFDPKYRSAWVQMYPLVSQSPSKIWEIDWRNPNNLILKTQLGKVYFGLYSEKFPQKIKALVRLNQLPSRIPSSRLAYIDLTNPDSPSVQLKPLPPKPTTAAANTNTKVPQSSPVPNLSQVKNPRD
jgi:cell division protein FtsQ